MAQDSPKICPNCHEKDFTTFSKCKFCGTDYDAVIQKNTVNINEQVIYVVLAALLLIGGVFYCLQLQKSARAQQMASITDSIKAANKPRLIELYTSWDGCAGGHRQCLAYNAIVERCADEYAGKIDVQRLNMEDAPSRDLIIKIAGPVVSFPNIHLFNRHGEEVAELKGNLTYAKLDKYLQDPQFLQ